MIHIFFYLFPLLSIGLALWVSVATVSYISTAFHK